MKDRLEIIDGRKMDLVTEHERLDIGIQIQDVLDQPFQILIGADDGVMFVSLQATDDRIYTWQKAIGWRREA